MPRIIQDENNTERKASLLKAVESKISDRVSANDRNFNIYGALGNLYPQDFAAQMSDSIRSILNNIIELPVESQLNVLEALADYAAPDDVRAISDIWDKIITLPRIAQSDVIHYLVRYTSPEAIRDIGGIWDKLVTLPNKDWLGILVRLDPRYPTQRPHFNNYNNPVVSSICDKRKFETFTERDPIPMVLFLTHHTHEKNIKPIANIWDKITTLPKGIQEDVIVALAENASPDKIELAIDNIIMTSRMPIGFDKAIQIANAGLRISPEQSQQPESTATSQSQSQPKQVG